MNLRFSDPRQRAPRLEDDRHIDHASIELYGSAACRVVGRDYASRPNQFLFRGEQRFVDDGHLPRMNAKLSAEAEATGAQGVVAKPSFVIGLDGYAVYRGREPCQSRRHGDRETQWDKFRFLPVALDPRV
jgi:hypothetical protein